MANYSSYAQPRVYEESDVHLIKPGEIVVEFVEHQDGFPTPIRFARFRAYRRAQIFADRMRIEGHTVKAWVCDSGDQSHRISI